MKPSFAKALLSVPGSLNTWSAVICRDVSCRIWNYPVLKINPCLCWVFVDMSIQNRMAGWLNKTHPFSDTFWKGSRERKPFFFLSEQHTLLGCVELYPSCPDILPLLQHQNINKFAFPCFSQLKATSKQTDTSFYSSFCRHLEKATEGHQWELHLHNLSRVLVQEVSPFEL